MKNDAQKEEGPIRNLCDAICIQALLDQFMESNSNAVTWTENGYR